MSSSLRRLQNVPQWYSLLIEGFLRIQVKISPQRIPTSIVVVCFNFYRLNSSNKDELSQIWMLNNGEFITIQMISKLIETLAWRHKQKIWTHHAIGQYIWKKKILRLLYSFVAYKAKLTDDTYDLSTISKMDPSFVKVLAPFVEVINLRVTSLNGLSLDEYKTKLHLWILEPISIFRMR